VPSGNKRKTNTKVAIRKEKRAGTLRSEMCLAVYHTNPGSRATNDGNTARHFFYLSSGITGTNEKLTAHFGTTIQAILSGFPTDSEAFVLYAKEKIIYICKTMVA
jgi:hypothetical protein